MPDEVERAERGDHGQHVRGESHGSAGARGDPHGHDAEDDRAQAEQGDERPGLGRHAPNLTRASG